MSDQDMFKEEDTTNTEPKQTETQSDAPTDPFADKLKEIVNEQGQPKYKDVETALKALKDSQQFIETLKNEKTQTSAELEQARAELARMGNIDDFVKKLNPAATTEEKVETPPATNGLSEEKVKQLLQEHLQQRDSQSQQTKNLAEVTQKLSEMYGDKSAEYIKQRAQELGTTVADLKTLSMTNPRLAIAALGAPKTKPAASQSSVNLPHNPALTNEAPKWERGATRGGLSNKELADRFRQAKEYTNKRIGLEN